MFDAITCIADVHSLIGTIMNLRLNTKGRTLFNLSSASRWHPIVDVTIRGLTLTATRYTYMDPHGVPSAGDNAMARSAAVQLEGTERVTVSDCNFTRLDGNGLIVSGYNRNASVVNNSFSWIGDNGVVVWGRTNESATNPLEGFDGTDGNHPQFTHVVGNVVREIGIYEKYRAWFWVENWRGVQTCLCRESNIVAIQ
jgi:hypothetical protein